ncbi:30S ribosomal protein S16 [Candidatus Desantisbacteria bacterium CG1_02_38_46]|uniref:Small ribosomal subunit protein bS16 n=3 Tax=unclassified Candidatus Desantisiibacteriota TaxID=3106372 RepID=A0A2H9PBR1_9BACT|nr:MAG: 30S ribosomal protein S16 [Candidatus Desantisbacteria bacterium CG1_02_38_46]PIU51184.1 MAG: 30S ribosomal protein S16 [Candidatus Desantisbacteria bacterium CG07_land_8_20_14_0_80_39_15]PIZ16363.1 MAG: 30S ribosomal protein S16 [Candidatus Desantisbacteria bacterium CG_4_10_14_0_8_um_filter_39_17]
MLKIRLRRVGGKNKPCYQLVLCDSRVSVRGKIIEKMGNFNPKLDPPLIGIKRERIDYWVKKGAKFSDRVESLLKKTSETTTGGLNEVAG